MTFVAIKDASGTVIRQINLRHVVSTRLVGQTWEVTLTSIEPESVGASDWVSASTVLRFGFAEADPLLLAIENSKESDG